MAFQQLCYGTILNIEITNKKHRNAKDMAVNWLWKGYLFTIWKLKQENRVLSYKTACWMPWIFYHSAQDHESDLGLQINFSKYVNLQIRKLPAMKIKTVVRNTLRSHGVNLLVLRSFKGKKTACIILRSKCVVKWREIFF